jgi:chromosome partitioning protein
LCFPGFFVVGQGVSAVARRKYQKSTPQFGWPRLGIVNHDWKGWVNRTMHPDVRNRAIPGSRHFPLRTNMAVITFANTKGGAGKTTAVLLLATELARKGYRITILDADPQHWISRWHEVSGHVANISVIDFVTSASLPHHISDNKHNTDYFIIDLPGARNPMLATAIGLSDHVLIPIQGCAMDARGGAQVLELLQYLDEKAGIKIGHSVVLTRVNSMVTTRALALVKSLLSERQVPVLDTAIIERSAFRDIFDCGGTLHTLDPARASNVEKARENALCFAEEIMRKLPVRLAAAARMTGPLIRSAA